MEKKELKKYSVKTKFFRAITYGVLVLLALICIVPFYNMIINCTHDNAALATSFQMTPGKSLKTNYQHLAANVNIWRGLFNSLFISLASTVITVYVGALTAYGFAKYKFKYIKQLFWLVLATMMLPGQLGIIGYFQLMNNIHMLDNYAALLITCFAPPAMVFWNRQYIDSYVPDELIDRFGDPPQAVKGLVDVALVRNTNHNAGSGNPGHFHLCGILERLCEAVHSFVLPGQIHTAHSGAADAGSI